jgi:hypothetical protein
MDCVGTSPLPTHDRPLAEGTLLREAVMQTLRTPYPSAKLVREVVRNLIDYIAKAVTTQTFVAHTATDLSDEKMEVKLRASHFDHIWSHSHLPGLSPCGLCSLTGLTHTKRPPSGRHAGDLGETSQQETLHLTRPLLPDCLRAFLSW